MDALIVGGKKIRVDDVPLMVFQSVALACEVPFSQLINDAADNPVGGPLLLAAVCKHFGAPMPETYGEYRASFVGD